MTKSSSTRTPSFRCTECGATALRWVGRCGECQTWGTVEAIGAPTSKRAPVATAVTRSAQPIGTLSPLDAQAKATGIGELDRVLGGGLVPGSVVLLAGEPGVGKSTLLLEVAHRVAANGQRALIVTGEESTAQVRLRAERIDCVHDELYLAAENDLGALLAHVDQVQPSLLVVDSVQTISTDTVDSGAGGVPQIRAVAAAVISVAKQRGIATVLVGHVTKDGGIAGPRVLEHLVDVVLHFEGDRHSSLRLVRASKNRFGAADEVGCFEMRENGIVGLPDPSGLFLSERAEAVPGTCVTVTVEGRRALITEIQALTMRAGGSTPRRSVSDLDGQRVAMLLAVLTRHARLPVAENDVYAATVGGIDAHEPAADLGIAIALASAVTETPVPATMCAIGEVSLSGDVRRVRDLERRLAEAARLGFTTAFVPAAHVGDAMSPGPGATIRVVAVHTVGEAVAQALALANRGGFRSRRPHSSVNGDAPRLRPVVDSVAEPAEFAD